MNKLLRLSLFAVLFQLTGFGEAQGQTADFTITFPSGQCAPQQVNFNATSGGVTSWSWSGAITSSSQSPSKIFNLPGTYSVTLVVNGNPGLTKTQTFDIYAKPSVTFTATNTNFCAGLSTTFNSTVTSNATGTTNYYWTYGDGYSDSGPSYTNPTHTYTTAGTYQVSVTVTNGNGCDSTFSRSGYITVNPIPTVSFTVDSASFCHLNGRTTFTGTTANGTPAYTYTWNYGDGSAVVTGNPVSHVYSTGGVFPSSVSVRDANGCSSNTATQLISVNNAPATFTFSPANPCFGDVVFFNSTTTGSVRSDWNFGDGNNGVGSNTFHSYQPGTYSVTVSDTFAGCRKSSAPQLVTINSRPQGVSFTYSPLVPCPTPPASVVTFTASTTSSGIGNTYTWFSRNNVFGTGNPITKTYTSNVADTIKVIVTNAAGCVDSSIDSSIMIRKIIVNIEPGPGPAIPDDPSPHAGCVPLTVPFSVSLYSSLPPPPTPGGYFPYPGTAITHKWDFGDPASGAANNASTLANPTHTYAVIGDYVVTDSITTNNGCVAAGTRNVHVDTKVKPSLMVTKQVLCPHEIDSFLNTTVTTATNVVYTWDLGETTVTKTNALPFTYAYLHPGTYDIKLYTDHKGCTDDTTMPRWVTVNPPEAKFDYIIECPPSLKVDFTSTSTGASSVSWDFGDGSGPQTNPTITHNFPAPGTYTITLTATNATYGCTDVFSKIINLYTSPLSFSATDSTPCVGDFIEFTASYIRSGTIEFSWYVEGAQSPYSQSPIFDHQYATREYDTVKLFARYGTGTTCYDTLSIPKFISVSKPVVGFMATPLLGCAPLNVSFTDTSSNTPGIGTSQRVWTFGDANSASNNLATTTNKYYFKGDFNVQLKVTDAQGCSDSLLKTHYVSVHHPEPSFTTDKTQVCTKSPVVLTSTSVGDAPLTYSWDFGDGGPLGSSAVETHRYQKSGTYDVKLILTDDIGCKDSFLAPAFITAAAPIAGFTQNISLSVCPTVNVQFTDTSHGATQWYWDFGTGSSGSGLPSPAYTFNGAGLYNVIQVVTNSNGCTDTARSQVRVLGYNGGFTYTPVEGCKPLTVRFDPPAPGIAKITWDFDDNSTAVTPGTSITHTYPNAGSFLPTVIFSDGHTCNAFSSGVTPIHVDSVNADFSWAVPCVDTPFSLNESSNGLFHNPDQWFWIFGGGDTATGPSPSYRYASSGNHAVTMIAVNSLGCKDTITKQVFINPLPDVKTSGNKGLCPGDSTKLFATGASSYEWSPASLVSCTACDTTLVYILPVPTWYYVVGKDANGCYNRDSAEVYIQLKTTDSTSAGGAICIGEKYRLFATGADHYQWFPADQVDSPQIASPLAFPKNTTTFLLVAQEGTCKVDSEYITIAVHSQPVFSAGNDEIIGRGSSVTLHPTKTGITRIEWQADTTLSCLDCFLPNAHPRYTRTYYVTGYNEFGCSTTDSVTVFVRCNGDLVFIPNTFSPNGDGNNDVFYPRGEGIDVMSSFRIFNRWGELVFDRDNVQLNDEHAGWDGTFRGQVLPPDVYVYTMQSRCEDGQVLKWKGDITLLR